MIKIIMIVLTSLLLAFAAEAQEKVPSKESPLSKEKDSTGGQKKITDSKKLPRMNEIDYLESRLERLVNKIDPNVSGRKAIPYRIEHSKKTVELMENNGYWGSLTVRAGIKKKPDWWITLRHFGYEDIYQDSGDYWPELVPSFRFSEVLEKWLPKYKEYIEEKYGPSDNLSPRQIEQQAWYWLIPYEKEDIKKLEEEYAQILKSIQDTRERLMLAKKEEELRKKTEDTVDDIKKEPVKPGEPRAIDAEGNGMLIDKVIRLSDLEGCGTMITGFNPDEEFGRISTPCPGLTGGLEATQKDYLTVCKTFEEPRDAGKMQAYPHPTGLLPVCSTDVESVPLRTGAGLRGTLTTALCNRIKYDLLANNSTEIYNRTVEKGGLRVVFKYDNKSRKLECFFLSKKQYDFLHKEFKNSDKTLLPADR